MKNLLTFELNDFNIQSTGADGGHSYLVTNIKYQGNRRRLVVMFADKADEKKLHSSKELTVQGDLVDDGEEQDLMLYQSKLI